jgi:DNA invertase Pin-like site-specific DNA recombinase
MQKIWPPAITHTEPRTYRKIGYARVSTRDQTLRLQIDALVRDGIPEGEIYRETISARAKRRPVFDEMMREIRPGDMIVVWKPDRLFRSLKDGLDFITEMDRHDIKIRILTQLELDTSTASGNLVMHLLLAIAEFEADLTYERTMAGLRSAKDAGRVGGARLTFSDDQIRKAVEMFEAGATWAEAAATVKAERGKRRGKAITVTRLRARATALKEKNQNVRECA